MSKAKTGRANAWPWWKLRAFLPDSRRWGVLRLVQLHESMRVTDNGAAMTIQPWQFLRPSGQAAGVGLFASREAALKWARTHCDRVVDESAEVAS